ncbi:hypothetical protein K7432_009451 [Basidiobolus ranarum]|uniref:chitin synthase n=1 Tax=Basidiobolus ranarum TaxID=34480 RepID=A0ABR2WQ66_9FUNG
MSLPNSEPKRFHNNLGDPCTDSNSTDSFEAGLAHSISLESTTTVKNGTSDNSDILQNSKQMVPRFSSVYIETLSDEGNLDKNSESLSNNEVIKEHSSDLETYEYYLQRFNDEVLSNLDSIMESPENHTEPHSLVKRDRHPTDRRYPKRIHAIPNNLTNSIRSQRRTDSDDVAGNLKNDNYRIDSYYSEIFTRLPSMWILLTHCATFYAPTLMLSCCGMSDISIDFKSLLFIFCVLNDVSLATIGMKTSEIRQAWREKMALCTIIFILCLAVGFLTFGFQQVFCGFSGSVGRVKQGTITNEDIIIHGKVYQLNGFVHPGIVNGLPTSVDPFSSAGGQDLSFLFQSLTGNCQDILQADSRMTNSSGNIENYYPCITRNASTPVDPQRNPEKVGCHPTLMALKRSNNGRTIITKCLFRPQGFLPQISRYSTPPPIYDLVSKRSSSHFSQNNSEYRVYRAKGSDHCSTSEESVHSPESSARSHSRTSTMGPYLHVPPHPPPYSFQPFNFPLAYTILLVTCYSEGEEGIRATLDSLAQTDYPTSHKLIVVIADGVIVGAGNEMSTPDICLTMMKDFVIPPNKVQPYSYIAIADGTRRHNMAKIYAGYYKFNEQVESVEKAPKVPMILISKCGTPEEQSQPKSGNRGKRDGQIILMSFLQHVMFDDRMTEMEYELFNAMWSVTGISPDHFEILLMVDADTKVYPDSLTRMVSCMVRDPQIMGLCGETKIANKRDSWVTMIQVFEYYISHHLSKAFESIFGGVTCLPGCFCMYRIKAPKGPTDFWVPVLASPNIVEEYSENVIDTLHKKNLLLLGEDRYLTTLMLRTFPKRKMIFVPQAVCKTVVPDTFKILLSQRRRWINSTIHNLLELVMVGDLCGTFCFSMQFVVFMELVGTVVLPAAICFTLYLVIISLFTFPVPIIPLILLAMILGLPAILILMTTRKVVYVGWMLIYLSSLFIWNFILPVYAFWHFDDFSWGQTRQVAGEKKTTNPEDKDGEFDSSQIVMKRWSEFEKEKRQRMDLWLNHVRCSTTSIAKGYEWSNLGYNIPSQLAKMNLSLVESEANC